jgi:hypothetical protein
LKSIEKWFWQFGFDFGVICCTNPQVCRKLEKLIFRNRLNHIKTKTHILMLQISMQTDRFRELQNFKDFPGLSNISLWVSHWFADFGRPWQRRSALKQRLQPSRGGDLMLKASASKIVRRHRTPWCRKYAR